MQGSNESAAQRGQDNKKSRPLSSGTPLVVQNSERSICIHLVADDEVELCPFWVALFKEGDLSPRDINSIQSTGIILNKVIDQGVNATSSIMLTDTGFDPPRYIYLIPKSVKTTVLSEQVTPELIPSIKAWNTDKIGIYLAPEVIQDEVRDICLIELITECIASNLLVDYYLYTGSLGLNSLLNQAIKLKDHLSRKKIKVCVFH